MESKHESGPGKSSIDGPAPQPRTSQSSSEPRISKEEPKCEDAAKKHKQKPNSSRWHLLTLGVSLLAAFLSAATAVFVGWHTTQTEKEVADANARSAFTQRLLFDETVPYRRQLEDALTDLDIDIEQVCEFPKSGQIQGLTPHLEALVKLWEHPPTLFDRGLIEQVKQYNNAIIDVCLQMSDSMPQAERHNAYLALKQRRNELSQAIAAYFERIRKNLLRE